jgi:hypothetical protein
MKTKALNYGKRKGLKSKMRANIGKYCEINSAGA